MGEVTVKASESSRGDYRMHILDSTNYTIWSQHTKNVLEAKGLLDAVKDDAKVDVNIECQARAILTSSMNADNQMKVINCKTAFKIWTRLKSIYSNTSSFQKENLLNKLHSYKISSTAEISQGISEMESIAAQLGLLNEVVSNESLMSAILRALPRNFKTFITVWKGTPAAERTIDNLLTRLMAEVEDEREPAEKALYVQKKFNYFNKS